MSEYLVIRLTAADAAVEWLAVDSNGTRQSALSSGSLEQAAASIGHRTLIALVPAEDVLSTSVNIPASSLSRIKTALPFALEEDLANDVEDLHFAIGKRQTNDRLPVAIVAREKMDGWLERLHSAGIEAAIMSPANHGVAKIPGTLSMVVDEDQSIMFNDGADTEFTIQGVKPSDVLVMAGELGEELKDDEDKSGHLLAFCTPESDARLTHDWNALRHELHSVDVNVLPDGILPKLAVTVAAGHGVNLLQGDYGKKTEYAALFRPWKIAAALLLGFVITGMAFKGVGYYHLLQETENLQAQFAAEYQLIRPGDKAIISDPNAIVNSLRRSSGASGAPQVFLPSLRELGEALLGKNGIDIEAISYRAGVIDLRLTAPNVSTLDEVTKSVSASGRFQASILRTDQVADKIDGRIQIKETGK